MSALTADGRERVREWGIDQAGGQPVTFDQALEAWQHTLAFQLLRLGYHRDDVPDMLGQYLPGDELPEPAR